MRKKLYRVRFGNTFQSVIAINRKSAINKVSKNFGIPKTKVKSARQYKR